MTKSMPWFRFWNETIYDVKISAIADEMDKPYHEVLGMWTMILCLASQSPMRGKLYVTFQKRFTKRGLAQSLRVTEPEAQSWLDAFTEMEMLTLCEGDYCITNWDKRQFNSDNSSARVEKYRNKKRVEEISEACNVSVTLPFNSDSDSINTFVNYIEGLLIKGDREKLPQYLSPTEAQLIYSKITGFATFPGNSSGSDIDRICAAWTTHKDHILEIGQAMWNEWNNRGYSRTNSGWLDWLVAGGYPDRKNKKSQTHVDAVLENYARERGIKTDGN